MFFTGLWTCIVFEIDMSSRMFVIVSHAVPVDMWDIHGLCREGISISALFDLGELWLRIKRCIVGD